jgi:acyl-coenzyme A thioesterase PaaI-like protein
MTAPGGRRLLPYHPPSMTDHPPAEDDAAELRRRVGDGLRAVIDDLLCHETPEEGLRESLALLDRLRRALDGPPAPPYNAVSGYWTGAAASWGGYMDMTMFGGGVNPLGMPMPVDFGLDDEGRPFAQGTVRLGRAYLGGPNMVHGGYVAGLLDHMFGLALHAGPMVAVTATLTVRYLAPTPVGQDLRLRAWFEPAKGRRVVGRATCHHGEVLTAEAEGLFLKVDRVKMAERNGGDGPPP